MNDSLINSKSNSFQRGQKVKFNESIGFFLFLDFSLNILIHAELSWTNLFDY